MRFFNQAKQHSLQHSFLTLTTALVLAASATTVSAETECAECAAHEQQQQTQAAAPVAPATAEVPAQAPATENAAEKIAEPKIAEPKITESKATPKGVWSEVYVSGPYIAMTFDDGPHPTLTPKLLDLLAQLHIHATFFVLGEMVKNHPEILQRAVAEGHEIGDHSWSHPNLAKLSEAAVKKEILNTSDLITKVTGKKVTLMRPPYGALTPAQRKWIHNDLGMDVILWDVDPFDWKRPGSAVVEHRILEQTHKGSIILSHDIHAGTIDAMPDTLATLLQKGYKFVTVSELIAMAEPEPAKTNATTPVAPTKNASSQSSPAATKTHLPKKISSE